MARVHAAERRESENARRFQTPSVVYWRRFLIESLIRRYIDTVELFPVYGLRFLSIQPLDQRIIRNPCIIKLRHCFNKNPYTWNVLMFDLFGSVSPPIPRSGLHTDKTVYAIRSYYVHTFVSTYPQQVSTFARSATRFGDIRFTRPLYTSGRPVSPNTFLTRSSRSISRRAPVRVRVVDVHYALGRPAD